MNILLVLPRVFPNLSEPTHFPVGMAYVSSSLKKAGHCVSILNLNFETGDVRKLLEEKIHKNDIEIVETGGLVTHYWLLKEILDSVKEINPNIYTLVGGGYVTGDPELAMEALPNADFGVFGEGEITNHEVSLAIQGKMKYDEVKGLIYRACMEENNSDMPRTECIKNLPREEILDLDSLPWPDYEGFQLDKMLEYMPKKYVTMSTGRSCKFHCTFCFHTSGQRYRQRSLDGFFDELDYLVQKYGIDNIYITDELFADDFNRLNEFCRRIRKYNVLWAIQLRVNIVTKELLTLLKDNGCIIISFGLESADNRILRSMRKGITVEMIENALQCSYEVGIEAHGAFIFGDIEENRESVENTLRWWKNHRQYNVNLALIQVFPGTYLYQYACDKGIIKDKVAFLEQGCPYINVSRLSDKEYLDLGLRLLNESSETYDDIDGIVDVEPIQRNRVNISYKCTDCGSLVYGKRYSTAMPTVVKCKNCEKCMTFNPFLFYKENVICNLNKIIGEAGRVVFWEANNVLAALLRAVPKLQNLDYEIVSSNNIMHGQIFCGHVIRDESILNNEAFDTVIICDYTFNTYIYNYINTRYKNKKIYSSGTLVEYI